MTGLVSCFLRFSSSLKENSTLSYPAFLLMPFWLRGALSASTDSREGFVSIGGSTVSLHQWLRVGCLGVSLFKPAWTLSYTLSLTRPHVDDQQRMTLPRMRMGVVASQSICPTATFSANGV